MDRSDALLVLAPEDDPDSVVLTRDQRRELLRRYQELEQEIERLRKIEAEFTTYKKRHPETVGVKFGRRMR